MSTKFRLGLVLLFVSLACGAAEVSAFRHGDHLGVLIAGTHYPATLHKDLSSGLTNTLLIRTVLVADAQVLRQRTAQLAIKYDLWEETFTVTTRLDGATVNTKVYAGIEDVLAALAQLKLPNLFDTTELAAVRQLVIQTDILLNPLDRERMEKIRKWVAENSARAPPDPSGVGNRVDPVGASNGVFNKIFEQYAAGASVAAIWTESAASEPLRLQDVPDARAAK